MQTRNHNTYYYRDNNYMLTLKNQKFNSTIELCKKKSNSSFLIKILNYHQSHDKIIFYSQKINQKMQNIEFKLNKNECITEAIINLFPESNNNELIKLKYKTFSSNNTKYALFTLTFLNKTITQIVTPNKIPQSINEFDEILLNIYANYNLNNNLFITNIINKITFINTLDLNISNKEQEIINNSLFTLSRTK